MMEIKGSLGVIEILVFLHPTDALRFQGVCRRWYDQLVPRALPVVRAASLQANQKIYYTDVGNVYESSSSEGFEHLGLIGGGYERMELK